jgi:exodeoxyribonuclease I
MENTYLFYDIETTGLNPCFDQILQFAAIRTDLSLNEIDRYECMIKLNPDVTPHPEAMKTHQLSMDDINRGKSEIVAVQEIHELMNMPGTISIGYNTLGFDDEFLRFSFYRNLLPPYTHQYANRCYRMDIYPMIVLYYLFNPDTIKWPKVKNQISLKLENINKENQFFQGQSHHAMVDVEVTLELAKALQNEQNMWDYLAGCFVKNLDGKRIRKLPRAFDNFRIGLLCQGSIGSAQNFLAPAVCIGQHNTYSNQTLWLRLDDERLMSTDPDAIEETTYVVRKKAGETPLVLPPEDRFLEKIDSKRLDQFEKNKRWLIENKTCLEKICNHYRNYIYPEIDNVDPDAALYQTAFATRDERNIYNDFHQAEPEEKEDILAMIPNPVRKEQALRIMGRHFPEHLSAANQQCFSEYMDSLKSSAIVDFRGQKRYTET